MDDTNATVMKLLILLILVITVITIFKIQMNADFLKQFSAPTLSVGIFILGLMVFFSIIDFDLTPVEDKHIEKVVDIEAFDSMTSTGFCKSHEGDRKSLQESCSKLTKDNCLATSCCVYAKMKGKEQCHSGDQHGPTFRRNENGKTHDIDYYYFRHKCYGNGCPKENN
jgi:hypothetical protein